PSQGVGLSATARLRSLARPCYLALTGEDLMNVTIPKSLEELVRQKVDEGHYSTEDEVVADALRLMQARDEVAQIKRARLQDAIQRGYEDAAAGKVTRLEGNDEIDALFADL